MKMTLTICWRLFVVSLFLVAVVPARYAGAGFDNRDGHSARREPPVPEHVDITEIERLERTCFDQVNNRRIAAGLIPFTFSEELLVVARSYSQRMAEDSFFSHADPQGRHVRERVNEAGIRWRMLGENLATSRGYINPVAVAMRGWMESAAHRGNILNSGFRESAVGVWISDNGTTYFTEVFLG
ncbi:MAG TPA: CAP domain-containing protein [Blastocatellia bacterium]|nr:CAP domain-containing protein [Blastocatellia bacterium]